MSSVCREHFAAQWADRSARELLPDETLRQIVLDEMPEVPRSFYDETIELPSAWWTHPAAYVQLGPAYADELARAHRLGWPTIRRHGGHLDLAVHPAQLADEIIELVAATLQAG